MTEAREWQLIIARLESRISCSWNFLMERHYRANFYTHMYLLMQSNKKQLPEDKNKYICLWMDERYVGIRKQRHLGS